MEWRLADAKNRFSELVNRALSEGPNARSVEMMSSLSSLNPIMRS